MVTYNRILVPTDFSELSYQAVRKASEYARHFDAILILVHVTAPFPTVPSGVDPAALNLTAYQQEMMENGKKWLQEVRENRVDPDVETRSVVVQGEAYEEIVRIADETEADLIVISTHGKTGLNRLVFGSVTEKVLRLSECSILIVRNNKA